MEKKMKLDSVDTLAIASLRALVIDITNRAKSGHPGMALDIAPVEYLLYRNFLVSDPKDPKWFNRDRFVLSSGHTSALLYSILFEAGFDLTMDDLKNFRQWGSLTPGHPEVGLTAGVDATSGPLGQGISQAVGVALAERTIRSSYVEGEKLCSHKTYCLCGDGDLEEGLSQEAISFAGLQKLNNLILIYDANGSTLDSPTDVSLVEDEKKRFEASHWRVFEVEDGNDLEAINEALEKSLTPANAPTLIIVHTRIGYGSPLEGNHKVHGAPLGEEMGEKTKEFFHYDYPEFSFPDEVKNRLIETFAKRGELARKSYIEGLKAYSESHPEDYKKFMVATSGNIDLSLFPKTTYKDNASRSSNGDIIAHLGESYPFIIGGSADVAGSVKTAIPNDPGCNASHPEGRNLSFGIREFQMAGTMNGILLHSGLRAYAGCFLIFSDYLKAAIRMSSLEHLPAIYLFSHDSLAVGEDGPTHEPIEQLAGLRAIPGVDVIRPADEKETYAAWKLALKSTDHPTCLILSRQGLPLLTSSEEGVEKGAYIILKKDNPALELLASGSEVSLALKAADLLSKEGIEVEVVSFPSWYLFSKQEETYQNSVLHLERSKRLYIEMSSEVGLYRYADNVYGIDRFGASAPADKVLDEYGFTPEKLAEKVKGILRRWPFGPKITL